MMLITFRQSGTELYATLPLTLSERERDNLFRLSVRDAKGRVRLMDEEEKRREHAGPRA